MLIANFFKFLNKCIFCQIDNAREFGVCSFCKTIFPWITKIKHKCAKCQKELAFHEQLTCTACKNNNIDFHKIFAIFSYEDPIKKLLLDLKFRQKLAYADFLGKILYNFVLTKWYQYAALPEAIIPVPLHADRLRSRGFNQAFELSRLIATKIPINHTACIRSKNTIRQTSLLKTNRNINIKHAFQSTILPYKHIAILDDVITTGGTIKSLCQAVKKNNPNINIDVWCIARA